MLAQRPGYFQHLSWSVGRIDDLYIRLHGVYESSEHYNNVIIIATVKHSLKL